MLLHCQVQSGKLSTTAPQQVSLSVGFFLRHQYREIRGIFNFNKNQTSSAPQNLLDVFGLSQGMNLEACLPHRSPPKPNGDFQKTEPAHTLFRSSFIAKDRFQICRRCSVLGKKKSCRCSHANWKHAIFHLSHSNLVLSKHWLKILIWKIGTILQGSWYCQPKPWTYWGEIHQNYQQHSLYQVRSPPKKMGVWLAIWYHLAAVKVVGQLFQVTKIFNARFSHIFQAPSGRLPLEQSSMTKQ